MPAFIKTEEAFGVPTWDAASFDWRDWVGARNWLRWAQENGLFVFLCNNGTDQYAIVGTSDEGYAGTLRELKGLQEVFDPDRAIPVITARKQAAGFPDQQAFLDQLRNLIPLTNRAGLYHTAKYLQQIVDRPSCIRRNARVAADVFTDSASIYALDPGQLQRLLAEGELQAAFDATNYDRAEQLIREHGGAVFHTGADGTWNLTLKAEPGKLQRVREMGFLTKATCRIGATIGRNDYVRIKRNGPDSPSYVVGFIRPGPEGTPSGVLLPADVMHSRGTSRQLIIPLDQLERIEPSYQVLLGDVAYPAARILVQRIVDGLAEPEDLPKLIRRTIRFQGAPRAALGVIEHMLDDALKGRRVAVRWIRKLTSGTQHPARRSYGCSGRHLPNL